MTFRKVVGRLVPLTASREWGSGGRVEGLWLQLSVTSCWALGFLERAPPCPSPPCSGLRNGAPGNSLDLL